MIGARLLRRSAPPFRGRAGSWEALVAVCLVLWVAHGQTAFEAALTSRLSPAGVQALERLPGSTELVAARDSTCGSVPATLKSDRHVDHEPAYGLQEGTGRFLLVLGEEAVLGRLLGEVRRRFHWVRCEPLEFMAHHYVLTVCRPALLQAATSDVSAIGELRQALGALPGVVEVALLSPRRRQLKHVPDDPLFPLQWHLRHGDELPGVPGVDIAVTAAWDQFRGVGVTVAIVDDGLEMDHPDLAGNVDRSAGYDYRDEDADPRPEGLPGLGSDGLPVGDAHGTATAGIVGAVGDNQQGGVGVAFGARLAGVRLIGVDATDDQEARALAHRLDVIQVSNNSWGEQDDGQTKGGLGLLAEGALRHGVEVGRGGLGTLYVWSAGNGGMVSDNANYDSYVSSIYTLAVGAITDEGRRPAYSEPGACLVVSAPAGHPSFRSRGLVTTDRQGDHGFNGAGVADDFSNRDYTRVYGGTSAAAAVVSGVVALVLEANPGLGWRDVGEILMRSAAKVQPDDWDWSTNAAGLRFNHQYGAGLVQASAAVQLAQSWTNLGTLVKRTWDLGTRLEAIPDGDPVGVVRSVRATAPGIRVEQAVITLSAKHASRGDLAVTLISPSGMTSRLTELHRDRNADYDGFKLMSVFHWGETSEGLWRVKVADMRPGVEGMLGPVTLSLYGSEPGAGAARRPVIQASGWSTGGFNLTVQGEAGRTYVVEAGADLRAWSVLWRTNLLGTRFDYVDRGIGRESVRFYRVRLGMP